MPAELELADAIGHYLERSAGLANEFLDEVDRAVATLLVFPESSAVLEAPVRRKVLRKFPYSLLYMVEEDEIVIVAVASESREPRYWGSRL